MPARVGYIGKTTTEVGWWDYDWRVPVAVNSAHDLTVHDCNYRAGATTYEDSYYTTPDPVVTLDADEYPVSVRFSDYSGSGSGWFNSDSNISGSIALFLCHSSGQAVYDRVQFASFSVRAGESVYDTAAHALSGGSALAGEALDLYASGYRGVCLKRQCRINITTDYLARSVSAVSGGHGSVSVSAQSVARGGTVTVTAVPDAGCRLDSITASAGTLVRTSDTAWTFTMPSPAVNAVITAAFSGNPHGTVKYRSGSSFTECVPYVYDGEAFREAEPYVRSGGVWVRCSHA